MKKNKVFALVLSLVLVVGIFVACGGGGTSSPASNLTDAPKEVDTVEDLTGESASSEDAEGEKKVLVMATEATFPPYEYLEGTDVVGIDVDIATEIAKEMGMELQVENMSFDAIIPAINSGKADFGAAGMSITEARQKEVDFSIEYATTKQVIVTTKDSGILGEADLSGKTVGVQMGTVSDLVLTDDYPDVTLVQSKKYTDVAMDLANGNIDAIVMDSLPAEEMIKNNENFIICETELFTDVYAICVKKGNTEMLNSINTVLERLMTEGKIEEYTIKHAA